MNQPLAPGAADGALASRPRGPVTTIGGRQPWYSVRPRELWAYRDLFLTLGQRDVKLRYRQTALGVSWVLLQPLLAAGIFAFVFGTVAGLSSDDEPYFVFAYAGLLGWSAFSTSLTRTTGSLLANAALVAKVYFPRLILPASTLLATTFDFIITSSVMGVLLAVYDVPVTVRLLLVPVWLALLLAFALGLGLMLGALSVRYRDIGLLTPVATQMLLYISPVAYAFSTVPDKYQDLYALNPLTGMLEGMRWSILGGDGLSQTALVTAVAGPVIALALGMFVFRRQERSFADVI